MKEQVDLMMRIVAVAAYILIGVVAAEDHGVGYDGPGTGISIRFCFKC